MEIALLHTLKEKKKQNSKMLALLIDPDKPGDKQLEDIVNEANKARVDLIFLGGSLLTKDKLDHSIGIIKKSSDIPVILFPGSVLQLSPKADGLLFLSLISGRNPELLIGNHVISAPYIREQKIDVLPTGYMLIDRGAPTTASYMSGTTPIPGDKSEIAACTAMAGELLGLQAIYMDGGSGAPETVSAEMIAAVRKSVDLPVIVGGGIRDADTAATICRAGADVIVVGNATESHPAILSEITEIIHNL